MLTLRPYQNDCIAASLAGFEKYRKLLAVAPTGSGKAVMMAKMAQAVLPKRTLMLCHREELIFQAADKVRKATGIFPQIEKAEHRASMQAEIVVGGIQTLQGARLARWPQNHFGLIIPDEAHHSISPSWQNTLRYFDSHGLVWGCTATPDRGDKRNLGVYYEDIAYEISLFDLINQGYLSRISVSSIPIEIDLRAVRQIAGDYSDNDLSDALAPYLRKIAVAIREHAAFRRTLVFLPLIATSKAFAEILNEEGLSAAHVDGTSEDRKEILGRFSRGEFDVLCNAMLLTEGYDEPAVDCVVILRPTKSRSLYSQMVGRGTRVAGGKANLLLLDFLWLHEKHNLIRPAHLVAATDEIAVEMTAMAQKAGGGESQEMLDLQGLASEAQIQREKRLQEELEKKAKRARREIDAMEWCLSIHAPDVAEYEDFRQAKPVARWQKDVLQNSGFDLDTIKSHGHADALINLIQSRKMLGLASPKQVRLMKKLGHKNADTISFDDARRYLDARLGSNKQKQAA